MNGHIVKPIDIQTVAEMPDRIFMQRKRASHCVRT